MGGLTHLVGRHKGQRHLGVTQRERLRRDVEDNGSNNSSGFCRLKRGFSGRSIFNSLIYRPQPRIKTRPRSERRGKGVIKIALATIGIVGGTRRVPLAKHGRFQ